MITWGLLVVLNPNGSAISPTLVKMDSEAPEVLHAPSNSTEYDVSKSKLRYLMLSLACLLCFGSYYVYDNPAALQSQLEEVICT